VRGEKVKGERVGGGGWERGRGGGRERRDGWGGGFERGLNGVVMGGDMKWESGKVGGGGEFAWRR